MATRQCRRTNHTWGLAMSSMLLKRNYDLIEQVGADNKSSVAALYHFYNVEHDDDATKALPRAGKDVIFVPNPGECVGILLSSVFSINANAENEYAAVCVSRNCNATALLIGEGDAPLDCHVTLSPYVADAVKIDGMLKMFTRQVGGNVRMCMPPPKDFEVIGMSMLPVIGERQPENACTLYPCDAGNATVLVGLPFVLPFDAKKFAAEAEAKGGVGVIGDLIKQGFKAADDAAKRPTLLLQPLPTDGAQLAHFREKAGEASKTLFGLKDGEAAIVLGFMTFNVSKPDEVPSFTSFADQAQLFGTDVDPRLTAPKSPIIVN